MAATIAAAIGLPGLSDMIPNPSLARPPGAFREDEFLDKCIRCRACANVCPVRGIGLAHLEQGLRNVGTPMLGTPNGYCMVFKGLQYPSVSKGTEMATAQVGLEWKKAHGTHATNEELCSECIKVCPTAALQPTNLDQLHMGTAVVYKDLCRLWAYSNCPAPCVDACLFDAITISVGPVVDAKKCVGCNQCSYVCVARLLPGPTGIIVEATSANQK